MLSLARIAVLRRSSCVQLRASRYSTIPPSQTPERQSSTMMPYIVGAVAGVGVIGAAGYGWYHFSGTKRIVDTALEVKRRIQETRAAAVKKREAAREQAVAVSAAAKEKTASISGRLRLRYQATKAAKKGEVSEEVAHEDTKEGGAAS